MGRLTAVYDAFAKVLNYPKATLYESALLCIEALADEHPDIVARLDGFVERVKELTLSELEELYIQTFDLNPLCTLDTGWQLFGEEYNRGLYLVKLRQQMVLFGLTETAELPDHITHVLALLGRMDDEAAEEFAVACVMPATQKILKSLKQDNLYFPVIEGLMELFIAQYGEVMEECGGDPEMAGCCHSLAAEEAHHG